MRTNTDKRKLQHIVAPVNVIVLPDICAFRANMVKLMDISLDSPITNKELLDVKLLVTERLYGEGEESRITCQQHLRKTVKAATQDILSLIDRSIVLRPEMTPALMNLGYSDKRSDQLLLDSHACASDVYKESMNGLGSAAIFPSLGRSAMEDPLPPLSEETYSRFAVSSRWNSLTTLILHEQLTTRVGWKELNTDNLTVTSNGSIFILSQQHDQEPATNGHPTTQLPILMSWDMLLMIKDATFSRFIAYMTIDFRSFGRSDGSGISHHDLSEIINWEERCITTYGNMGFRIVKNLESLTKAAIIHGVDAGSLDTSVLMRMYQKISAKERELMPLLNNDPQSSCCTDWLLNYLVRNCQRVWALGEVFGLMKLSGHPIVDPIRGADSSREIGKEDIVASPTNIRRLRSTFCHLFCRGFLGKMNRWPKLCFIKRNLKDPPSSLEKLFMRSGRLNLTADNYQETDWDLVRFGKEFDYDYGEDFLELVTDKAISPKRTEIWSSWRDSLQWPIPRATSSRRALLEMLATEDFDVRAISDEVSRRVVKQEDKIVCVYPKEREMKDFARMFAMMTLRMRTFFVNTEHNIANSLFRYIPQQTMTMTRQDLVKRLLEMSRPPRKRELRLNVEVDFERWNLRWRAPVVNEIARDFNDLYGVHGIFDYTHEFFTSSVSVLRHPSLPPDRGSWANYPDLGESEVSWLGHLGGYEGISQKVWTTPTICIVYRALSKLGLDFTLSGQGDNQVIAVTIDRTHSNDGSSDKELSSHWAERITKGIDVEATKVGQIVKPEECIESTGFVSYGKEMIADGVFLSSMVKQLSRCFPSCNTALPSMSELVSSIGSSCVAAAEKSDDPLCCFRVYLLSLALCLRREFEFSMFHGNKLNRLTGFDVITEHERRRYLCTLMSWPKNLGGIDVVTAQQFLYKNPTDPLSSSLAGMKLCAQDGTINNRLFRIIASGILMSTSPVIDQLVADPYSIPLRRPLDPSSAAMSFIRDTLVDLTKNKEVLTLLQSGDRDLRNEFVATITRQRPYYPKIVHDIYECTHFAVIDKFARRFTNTRTVVDVTQQIGEFDPMIVIGADLRYLSSVLHDVWKVLKLSRVVNVTQISVFKLCVDLRRRWSLGDLEGVTTIHPFELGKIYTATDLPKPNTLLESGFISARVVCTSQSGYFSSRGAFPPYLGSSTATRVIEKGVSLVNPTPPARAAIKILTIRNMISSEGSQLWMFLSSIACSRCDVAIEVLEKVTPRRVGGTIYHRHQVGLIAEGARLNSLPNAASHIVYSSDRAGPVATGDLDYPLPFQDVYLMMLGLLTCYIRGDLHSSTTLVMPSDVSGFPTIEDKLVSLTASPTFVMPTLPDAFYLVAKEISFSQNVLGSLRWRHTPCMRTIRVDLSDRDITLAIAELVVISLTKRREVRRALTGARSGATLSCPLDVPELRRITAEEFLRGCSLGLIEVALFGSVLGSRSFKEFLSSLLDRLYLLSRRIYGIIVPGLRVIAQHAGCPVGLRMRLGPSATSSLGLAAANALYTTCEATLVAVSTCTSNVSWTLPHRVYEDSYSSESSAYISAILKTCLGGTNARKQDTWNFIRRLAKSLIRMRSSSHSEDHLLDEITTVLQALGISERCVELVPGLPEDIIRSLRGRQVFSGVTHNDRPSPIHIPSIKMAQTHEDVTTLGGTLPLPLPRLGLSTVLESHLSRATTVLSSSHYTWAPIATLLSGTIIIWGIGSGGLGHLVERCSACDVRGIERADSLALLGPDMTHYVPPEIDDRSRYSTLDLSWQTSGDISDNYVVDRVKEEIARLSGRVMVLIDVDQVDNDRRLEVASTLSELPNLGIAVRLFAEPGSTQLLRASIHAISEAHELSWWPSGTYPDHETVLLSTHRMPASLCVPSSTPTYEFDNGASRRVADLIWSDRRGPAQDNAYMILTSMHPPTALPQDYRTQDLIDTLSLSLRLSHTLNQRKHLKNVIKVIRSLPLGVPKNTASYLSNVTQLTRHQLTSLARLIGNCTE